MIKLARRLFGRFIPMRDDLTIEAHAMALSASKEFEALISAGYSLYDLDYIVRAKAIEYYTGFDLLLNEYRHLAAYLRRVTRSRSVSNALAFRIMALRKHIGGRNSMTWCNETPLTLGGDVDLFSSHSGAEPCNLLFANFQTYLRVMVLYMRNSRLNNLLVVPRSMADVGILKQVDPSRLIYFDDFVSPAILEEVSSAREHFQKLFEHHHAELREAFIIDGHNFFTVIERNLRMVFHHVIPESLLIRLTVDRILDQINPATVIGARVRRLYDRAFFAGASSRGVPTFVLMHSDIGSNVRYIHKMGHFNRLKGVFAWGERQAQLILGDHFSDVEDVHITGSPLFVRVEEAKGAARMAKKKRIIYAGTSDDVQEVQELTRIIRSDFSDIQLIIKVHPGLDHRPYERYCQRSNVTLVAGDEVLEDLLAEVDLLITTISESSLQSMIREIPTLYLSLSGKWDRQLRSIYTFDSQEEQALVVRSTEELRKAIGTLFDGDAKAALAVQGSFLARRIRLHETMDGPVRAIDSILEPFATATSR